MARLKHRDCDALGYEAYVDIWRAWEGLRALSDIWIGLRLMGQPANQRLSSQIATQERVSERMPPDDRRPMAPHPILYGYRFRYMRGFRRGRPRTVGRPRREGAGGHPWRQRPAGYGRGKRSIVTQAAGGVIGG